MEWQALHYTRRATESRSLPCSRCNSACLMSHVTCLLCRISSLPKILIVYLRTYYWKNAIEEVLGCVHTQTYLLAYG